jgi:hypothetical protein
LPIITGQPAAKTITNIGGSMTLSVVATAPAPAGFPLTYQWRFNGNDLIDATDATITSNNLQVLDAGY